MKTLLEWEGKIGPDGEYILEKEPKLHYFSTCRESIKAIPVQIHDPKKPGDMKKKDGDDTCDTDRYAFMHMTESDLPEAEPTVMDGFVKQERKKIRGPVYAEKETGGGWMDS